MEYTGRFLLLFIVFPLPWDRFCGNLLDYRSYSSMTLDAALFMPSNETLAPQTPHAEMWKEARSPHSTWTCTGCMQHDMQHMHEHMVAHRGQVSLGLLEKTEWGHFLTTHWEHAVNDEQVADPARPTPRNPNHTNYRL